MSPLLGPSDGNNRVVTFRLRGKRSLQQRLVAEFFEGSATQAKRLHQSRYGPVEFSWTRTMSNPFSLHGKDDGVSRGPTR